jgi:thiosulfate reductase cytochrome b subunit
MTGSAWAASGDAPVPERAEVPRHSAVVRVTHWIAAGCSIALLFSGAEIVVSHPRFYWGESGNFYTAALFQLPIPSSRRMVETGYGYVLADQNGWSRALHFQSAWLLAATGLVYLTWGLLARHFVKNVLPRRRDLSPGALASVVRSHLRFTRASDASSYNALQRVTYAFVIFVLFPLVIWTGLAMSPAFVSAFPITVTSLGGQQSARTIHFFVSIALLLFFIVHIAMVCLAGFRIRMAAMIAGSSARPLGKIAHNGLAGRGEVRRTSPSFDAAPGGLCALEKIAHNGLAGRGEVRRTSPSSDAAPGGLCAKERA